MGRRGRGGSRGIKRVLAGAWRGIAPFAVVLFVLAPPQFATAGEAQAEFVYAARTLDILQEPASANPPAGRVFVASQMAVLERRPDWLRVELRGWYQDGASRVLYALPGKRILVATLKPSVAEGLEPLDSVSDPQTGIRWNGAKLQGWIRTEVAAAALEPIWDSAWQLFSTRCTACHQRRIPHKYTANQWVSLLKTMGPRTGLPKEDQRLILKYLQTHAKDTRGNAATTDP